MTKFSLVSLALLVGVGACAVACSSDDDTASGSAGAGGKGTAGAGGSAGAEEAGAGGEAGGSSLYTRLGGHAGIADALDAIVTQELMDPIIVTYFSQQADPHHKPSKTDIGECFTNLLGKAAGGPEEYPFTTSSGFVCRDMHTAHATLGIGAGTFDKFVSIAAAELTALGVSDADVTIIGGVLGDTKTDIVDTNVPSGAAPCASPATCALPVDTGEGGAGGSGGSN